MIPPILLLGLIISTNDAQAPAKPSVGPYKVAFWYEANRPTTSLRFQVYDLGKGQYDAKAVDLWLRTVLAKYPEHGAYVRDLTTEGLSGATEPERLALAIDLEKARWAGLQRRPSMPIPGLTGSSTTASRPARSGTPSPTAPDRHPPGSPSGISNPPASPFPYPYRSGPR